MNVELNVGATEAANTVQQTQDTQPQPSAQSVARLEQSLDAGNDEGLTEEQEEAIGEAVTMFGITNMMGAHGRSIEAFGEMNAEAEDMAQKPDWMPEDEEVAESVV